MGLILIEYLIDLVFIFFVVFALMFSLNFLLFFFQSNYRFQRKFYSLNLNVCEVRNIGGKKLIYFFKKDNSVRIPRSMAFKSF